MENQQQNDLEQNRSGQNSEDQRIEKEPENTENIQNDIAGNANQNQSDMEQDNPDDWKSETDEKDGDQQDDSLSSDGPVSWDEADDSEDLNETDTEEFQTGD